MSTSPNDTVMLVLLFKQGNMMIPRTRQEASDCMRIWYNNLDDASKMPWWKFYWKLLCQWRRPSPAALNVCISENKTLAGCCWDWNNVVGMYTWEYNSSPQERIAKAMEKQFDVGEDWKSGTDE